MPLGQAIGRVGPGFRISMTCSDCALLAVDVAITGAMGASVGTDIEAEVCIAALSISGGKVEGTGIPSPRRG